MQKDITINKKQLEQILRDHYSLPEAEVSFNLNIRRVSEEQDNRDNIETYKPVFKTVRLRNNK